jgi:hypothetical protein
MVDWSCSSCSGAFSTACSPSLPKVNDLRLPVARIVGHLVVLVERLLGRIGIVEVLAHLSLLNEGRTENRRGGGTVPPPTPRKKAQLREDFCAKAARRTRGCC